MTTQALPAEQPVEATPSAAAFQTEQVLTIGAGHFVNDTFSSFLAPLLPLIQSTLGIGYAAAGSLAIFVQIPSLLNPFIGYLADKVSVRYFVILAPGITATAFSCLGLAPTYAALAMLLFVAGISIAAFHAPAPAMVAKVAGEQVGKGMSIFMASGELARAVGPMLVVAGVAWFGVEGIWRMAVLGWGMSAILYVRLRTVAATPRPPGVSAMDTFWATARRLFPVLVWLLAGRVMMVSALTTYLPIYMNDERAASLWLAAAALTILQAAGVAGALATGTLSDRVGRRRILLVLLGLAPFLMIAFLYGPEWLAVPLLLLLGFAAISPQPVIMALVQDQFPKNRALANGTYLAITFLLQAGGIWLVGALSDRYGLTAAFSASAVVALLSIPAIRWLPGRSQGTTV
ncbi:MAG: MFS transporter [Caldilineales bacterium]